MKKSFEEKVNTRIKQTQEEIKILEKEITCKLAFIEALQYSIGMHKDEQKGKSK